MLLLPLFRCRFHCRHAPPLVARHCYAAVTLMPHDYAAFAAAAMFIIFFAFAADIVSPHGFRSPLMLPLRCHVAFDSYYAADVIAIIVCHFHCWCFAAFLLSLSPTLMPSCWCHAFFLSWLRFCCWWLLMVSFDYWLLDTFSFIYFRCRFSAAYARCRWYAAFALMLLWLLIASLLDDRRQEV